jgi:hypothetical protein
MKKVLGTLLLLFVLSLVSGLCWFIHFDPEVSRAPASILSAEELSTLNPVEAHDYATKYLRNVHFFADNEGMQVGIGFFDFWKKLRKIPLAGERFQEHFETRWGILFDEKGMPVGVQDVNYKDQHLSIIQCSACHFGKAYGEIIPGLGNKNMDISAFVEDATSFKPGVKAQYKLAFGKNAEFSEEVYSEVDKKVNLFFKRLTDPKVVNETQGLIPVGIVRASFYPDPFNLPEGYSKSQAKIPHLWGYGEKRKYGSFHDGFGDASIGAWAASLPYVAGQRPQTILKKSYVEKLKLTEEVMAYLQPPKYPLPIDKEAAERGENIFTNKCATCHRTYEKTPEGFAVYKTPVPIKIDVVKTDRDLFDGTTPYFVKRIESSPLASIIKFSPSYLKMPPSYLAPRLEGIWARFPYLHNGSVPTLDDLLKNENERPAAFDLYHAGEIDGFDKNLVGLRRVPRSREETEVLIRRAQGGDHSIYWIGRKGHSNTGHRFFLEKQDRKDVIEYLKTL